MGFFDDLDKPAFVFTRVTKDDDDKEKQELLEENKELRKLLATKKVKGIDVDYKLLE